VPAACSADRTALIPQRRSHREEEPVSVPPKTLVNRMTPTARQLLEAAIGRASSSQHDEVPIEHMLRTRLEPEDGAVAALHAHIGRSRNPLKNRVEKILNHMKTGNTTRPVFTGNLWKWVQDAWLYGSLEFGAQKVRSGHLFYTLVVHPGRYIGETIPELEDIFTKEELDKELAEALSVTREEIEAAPAPSGSGVRSGDEAAAGRPGADGALARFCTNFTEEVRAGRIDPIFGRHREVRQAIDILSRR